MDKSEKSNNGYNGYANWETWVTVSHLENTESIYKIITKATMKAKTEVELADKIKAIVKDDLYKTAFNTDYKHSRGYEKLLLQDIVEHFVENVSWFQIACNFWDLCDKNVSQHTRAIMFNPKKEVTT